VKPDVVIHTAGLTSVDTCEQRPELARRLNVEAARIVAEGAARAGAYLIHISTDQLFDGTRAFTDETTTPAPINVYGHTKRDAERAVLDAHPSAAIVRTNFFGWGTSIRTSFSDWILGALERSEPLQMFTDAYFTPILVNDLIDRLVLLIDRRASGMLHVAGSERLTKHAFALELADVFGCNPSQILGRPLSTFGLQARRPLDMSLSTEKARTLFGGTLPVVRPSLERLRQLRDEGWREELEAALVKAPV